MGDCQQQVDCNKAPLKLRTEPGTSGKPPSHPPTPQKNLAPTLLSGVCCVAWFAPAGVPDDGFGPNAEPQHDWGVHERPPHAAGELCCPQQQHPVQLASSQAAAPGIVSLCLFCLCLTAMIHSGSGVCCVCSGARAQFSGPNGTNAHAMLQHAHHCGLNKCDTH